MCCECKLHTEFQRLSVKKEREVSHSWFYVGYVVKQYFGNVGLIKVYDLYVVTRFFLLF